MQKKVPVPLYSSMDFYESKKKGRVETELFKYGYHGCGCSRTYIFTGLIQ